MRMNCGGALRIACDDLTKVDKNQLLSAFEHINWSLEGVESMLAEVGEVGETGFTFTGTTKELEKFLFAVNGAGVEIEVLKEPPTPEFAKRLEEAWNRRKQLGQ